MRAGRIGVTGQKKMNIKTVDLNLFLVFRAVYMTRNVTQAGDCVNMTQSAVSNALKRMRERFDDPLFIRTSTGVAPTPLADELFGPVEEGLRKLSLAIDKARGFYPATSDRLFRIAMNDIGQLVFLPSFLNSAREEAPQVRFETVGASSGEEARALLLEGKIDVALGSWRDMGEGFASQVICEEIFVALVGRRHPIRSEAFSMAQYLDSEHITYRPSGASDTVLQDALFAQGVHADRRVAVTVSHALGLAEVVSESCLVLSIPHRLARSLQRSHPDLRIVRLPFKVGPFQVTQQWHERLEYDSGNRWLREQICAAFRRSPMVE